MQRIYRRADGGFFDMNAVSISMLLAIVTLFFTTSSRAGSDKNDLMILGGFNTTGSEFIFWNDNTYGGNVQLIKELVEIFGGSSTIGFKGSGLFADGMTGGYGGLNLRIDEPFFLDLDALVGYSSITNADLLKSYNFGTTEYQGMAFVTSLGMGYRFQNNPWLLRIAYTTHIPLANTGLNTGPNFQLGYRF